MTFWQAYARFWTQAFNLKDRARRLEYWAPMLIHGIIGFFLIIISYAILMDSEDITSEAHQPLWSVIITTLLLLVFTIPNFTLLYRRFQDLNRSGWWALVLELGQCISESTKVLLGDTGTALTIIGIYNFIQLIIFIMMFFRGTEGPNKYGPDPYTGVYLDRTYNEY